MKTIGLIGGMSWESTVTYYQKINRGVNAQLGGLHSAKLILYSVDFAQIEALQRKGAWEACGEILAAASLSLQKAGAEAIVICTNTMHLVAPHIEQSANIPLLHIADATGAKLQIDGRKKVLLLGTRFTMEKAFYRGRLSERYQLQVTVPDEQDRQEVHRIIYEELCLGQIKSSSREFYLNVLKKHQHSGIDAVILGCTEIGLLISDKDCVLPVYDTVDLHAKAAVKFALSET